MNKRVIIAVTNDLSGDKRINKVAESLLKFGFKPVVIGRKLKNSLPVNFNYPHKRFKLLFTKGVLFYAEYNLRLFIYLIFCKADIFLSNDLDSLPASYFASKIRRKKLVYDSHEYFTEVPELQNRPKVQNIWLKIEKFILPKIKYSYTVCQSVADIYNKKYGINMQVVRNIPECTQKLPQKKHPIFNDINHKKIILYQGAVNIGRGLKHIINAMQYIDNQTLIIIGDGDILQELKTTVKQKRLESKVIFTGKIPFSELYKYTRHADIGISIEENIGLNYYYALPNKLFDYIRAGVPVLASELPEIKQIVAGYNIGSFIKNHEPKHIAEKIKQMSDNPEQIKIWKQNLKKASEELCWENEEIIIKNLFSKL